MNGRIKRIGHTAANRLFRLFSVDLSYQLPQKYDNESKPDHLKGIRDQKWSKPIKCHEPVVPISSQSANALVNAQEGTATQYQFIWLSKHDVPPKTKVERNNQILTIVDRASYKDLAGIFVYYLKGRSDIK